MTTLWILYATAVSLALCAAAAASERGLRLTNRPARAVWALALAACVGLPLLAHLAGPLSPLAALLPGGGPATGSGSAAPGAAGLLELLGSGLLAHGGGGASGPGTAPALQDLAAALEGPILVLWAALSVLLGGRLAAEWREWRDRRRSWRRERLDGRKVLVTEEAGPALAGLLRTDIVVPAWFLDLPRELRELALRHEEAHRRAGDHWLLLGAEILRVLLPWNPGIHWAVRRLRRAAELDCDRRLLRSGADRGLYGRLLVAVGGRGAGPAVSGAAALTERNSDLERRITMLTTDSGPWTGLRAAGAAALAVAGVAVACETPVPTAEEATTAARAMSARTGDAPGGRLQAVGDTLFPTSSGSPLLIVDGVVRREPLSVDALDIEKIEVVKGQAALESHGDRAVNGVIRITTGSDDAASDGEPEAAPRSPEDPAAVGESPLVIVDGEVRGTAVDLDEFDPQTIEKIEVVKGESARSLYGERARDGVIQITTRGGG